jgi:hypothetical protein
MELRLDDGQVMPIAQVGPDFLILKAPGEHPPSEGHIYLRIDDSESCWRVRLSEGISSTERETKITAARSS